MSQSTKLSPKTWPGAWWHLKLDGYLSMTSGDGDHHTTVELGQKLITDGWATQEADLKLVPTQKMKDFHWTSNPLPMPNHVSQWMTDIFTGNDKCEK